MKVVYEREWANAIDTVVLLDMDIYDFDNENNNTRYKLFLEIIKI